MDITKKSINIDLSKLEAWKKNPSIVFLTVLAVLVLLEVFVVKNSLSLLSSLNAPMLQVPPTRGVTINFDAYNKAVGRIQKAKDFQPTNEPTNNPFFGTISTGGQ